MVQAGGDNRRRALERTLPKRLDSERIKFCGKTHLQNVANSARLSRGALISHGTESFILSSHLGPRPIRAIGGVRVETLSGSALLNGQPILSGKVPAGSLAGGGAAGITVSSNNNNISLGLVNPTNKLQVLGGATFTSGNSAPNQTVRWTPGNASWSFTSDRNVKERIEQVDTKAVLERLSRLPVAEWSYQGYPQRHVGPMAQDLHEQFPLNENDQALNDADLHGVALAAIQGLNQKLETELKAKEAEIEQLKQSLVRLEGLVRQSRLQR